jgi:predicted dehydrogenase
MSKKNILKVGFVGCGGFTAGTHIPNVAGNPHFEIVGFCDLDSRRLDALAQSYQHRYVTTDMARLIADPEIDLVICGTKPDNRLPVMELALRHSKHLFVEKPLCYSKSDAAKMLALMRGAPGLFMVGYNRPFSPLMQDLKPFFQRHHRGNTTIVYRIVGEAQLWPERHYDAVVRRGESTILHEVTHIFDLLNWLTDSVPQRVYAAGGGNMDNIITLTYPENVTAVVIAGDNGTAGLPKERLEIHTNYGVIIGEEFVELTVRGFDGIALRRTYPYTVGAATFNDGIQGATERAGIWRQSITPAERTVGYYYERMVRPDKGHFQELEFFRRAIVSGTPSPVDIRRGVLANLIAWRVLESLKQNSALDFDGGELYGVSKEKIA